MPHYTSKSIVHLSDKIITRLPNTQIGPSDFITLATAAARKAAENIAQLNPLCTPLQIANIDTHISLDNPNVTIQVTVQSSGDKEPKIEAMFAAAAAAVTIWDIALALAKKEKLPYTHFTIESRAIHPINE